MFSVYIREENCGEAAQAASQGDHNGAAKEFGEDTGALPPSAGECVLRRPPIDNYFSTKTSPHHQPTNLYVLFSRPADTTNLSYGRGKCGYAGLRLGAHLRQPLECPGLSREFWPQF